MDFLLSFVLVIIILVIWSTYWKGRALWTAGDRKDKKWFIVMLILNTAGILPIIYLLTRKKKKL